MNNKLISLRRFVLVALLFAASLAVIATGPAQATEWDPHDLITNSDFFNEETGQPTGLPWQADFDTGGSGVARVYAADEEIMNGSGTSFGTHGNAPDPDNGETYALCMGVDSPGSSRWSVQLRHRNMVVNKDHRYMMVFDAWTSDSGVQLHPKLGHVEGPEYWNYNIYPNPADGGEWYNGQGDSADPVYGFPDWWDPIRDVPTEWTTFDKWWWDRQDGNDPMISYIVPNSEAPTELATGVILDIEKQWDFAVSEYSANDQEQGTVELTFHFGSQVTDLTPDGNAIWMHENPDEFALCIDNIQYQDIGPVGWPEYDPNDPEGWSPYTKVPTLTPDGIGPNVTDQEARAAAGEPVLAWSFRPIRVNQVGYFPTGAKWASVGLENAWAGGMAWTLHDSSGAEVAAGTTIPQGDGETIDADSGQYVHWIDFTSFTTQGDGYYLEIPEVDWGPDGFNQSQPFDIAEDLYADDKYDAIKYFYINRSGIEIDGGLLGGGVHSYGADSADVTWSRPAGHAGTFGASEGNQGDDAVPCYDASGSGTFTNPTSPDVAAPMPSGAWAAGVPTCDHTKDVIGGWYDAGDHGKYVVNGGISAWTLMNQYERMLKDGTADAFGDFQIPESGDGNPDLLDESRWQMEFMLKMQVDASETASMAGMVHHKMHDIVWTALGRFPHEVDLPRYLMAPTTAATLNLAATGAQCARLWDEFDSSFADQCWQAAVDGLAAAEANPDWFAPKRDDYFADINLGGGPYDDDFVNDEFYWAYAEAYITAEQLGKPEAADYKAKMESYKTVVEGELDSGVFCWANNDAIPHSGVIPHVVDCGVPGSFTWGTTSALGAMSLALSDVPESADAIADLKSTVDTIIPVMEDQGFLQAFAPDTTLDAEGIGDYTWGSNSSMVNNMVMMGVVHQTTDEAIYLDAMRAGVDYIFGRNPVNQCFVSDLDLDGDGLGDHVCENFLKEPHHRTFSWTYDPAKFPVAPPGWMSGGANSVNETWDPVQAIAAGLYCNAAPATCFNDRIDSWSTNEVTVNWNSPYAWVLAYLDDTASVASSGFKSDEMLPTPTPDVNNPNGGTVNCDAVWNLIDVILIKRFDAFLISSTDDCSVAQDNSALYERECDINDDNKCGLVDAVIIQQCNAFVPNAYCPLAVPMNP